MFFSKFERLVARRYLKAKRREGFYFGNYRLLPLRNCARRSDADYRNVGNERFPA